MISAMTASIGREITLFAERLKTSAGRWLALAAAPTFAIMALLAGIQGGGMPDMLCSAAPDAAPWTGMVSMYVLMSVFHLPPWLSLMSGRRNVTHPS